MGFGLGSTREASLNSDRSSSSSSANGLKGGGGGLVLLAIVWFLILGSTSVFLGGNSMVSGFLLVPLVEEVVIGSGEVAAPPDDVVEEGVVKVKMTARGRQRRIAQRRESGVGGSMVSRRGVGGSVKGFGFLYGMEKILKRYEEIYDEHPNIIL